MTKKSESGKIIFGYVFVVVFVLAIGIRESKGTIITSGTDGSRIALGVQSFGQLNAAPASGEVHVLNSSGCEVGIALEWTQAQLDVVGSGSSPGFYDAISPGNRYEGWGVSGFNDGDAGAGSGYVNSYTGFSGGVPVNLTNDSFTSTVSSVTSVTSITTGPALQVTQTYAASIAAPNRLFENKVVIKNTGATAIGNVRYVRVMDWDVPQTEFTEFSTIQGTVTTTMLDGANSSHDGGYSLSDPFAVYDGGDDSTDGNFGFKQFANDNSTLDTDYIDNGGGAAADTGVYFRFNFGSLAADAEYGFSIFYGAAGTEFDMLVGLQLAGAELYSLGNSNVTNHELSPTYAFAFTGVGGEEIVNVVPEPGTFALLGIGLAGLGYLSRKRIFKFKTR
ncbi:MAG: PEP-CTERM sorting domain-containing protein [Candidatus Brocadiales bacterium]|nr:PEP-CTERM sorting domain-containing protein [Candidatus Brocadiales bacterium]